MGVCVYRGWGGLKNILFYKYLVSNARSTIVIDKLSEKSGKRDFFVIKGYSKIDEALNVG